MKKLSFLALCLGIIGATPSLRAQFSISPLTTFAGGNGWFAPGEAGYPYLTTGNTERGLAYGNGHLYLVSRANVNGNAVNVRILDALTGSDLGALDTSGISGGLFVVDMVAVGGDGAIYVNNLTSQSTTTPFKVYKWATEGSTPTVAYSGDGGLAGARVGDSVAIIGAGSSTRLALGYNINSAVAGNNGYAIVDPTAGTATAVGFSGTPPNAGDFQAGITFSDSSHVLGTAGSLYRYTSFSGSAGTLLASPSLSTSAERLTAYAVVGGVPLLAVQNTVSSTVRIYDLTDPVHPILRGTANNTSGSLTSNFDTGELAWGDIQGNTAHLWAMSSNQGIQAFRVIVPATQGIAWRTIDGGGGTSTNSTLAITGTIGQPDAGKLSGNTLAIDGGFWGVIAVQTPGAPTLTIAAAAPGEAAISWSPNTPGFRLQESDTVSPANWTDSPSGTANPVTVAVSAPKKFYRLFKP
jgi:hypothetical protein